jgi:hypothetical protein
MCFPKVLGGLKSSFFFWCCNNHDKWSDILPTTTYDCVHFNFILLVYYFLFVFYTWWLVETFSITSFSAVTITGLVTLILYQFSHENHRCLEVFEITSGYLWRLDTIYPCLQARIAAFGSQDLSFRTSIFGYQNLGFKTSINGHLVSLSGPGFQDLDK